MAIPYGIIGTGWITDSWINATNKTGQWKLHAIYSRSKAQAESFGSKHSCSNLYTSLEEFAADVSMQAVYIASPNNLHYVQAKQMMQAKKHVILEKPATSTEAELDSLFHIAKENSVVLIEAFRHIQEANFKLLQRMIKHEKSLGPIYGASLQYASYSSRYTDVLREGATVPNVFSPEFSGGCLVDVGVYPVAFAVALFGAPESQIYAPFMCASGVDGGGFILLRYADFGVQINTSKGYRSTQGCEIYGERGTLGVNFVTDIDKLTLWEPREKASTEFAGLCQRVEKPDVNMVEEADEFARIIREEDRGAVAELEEISRAVMRITTDLRRQNAIVYPADGREEKL